MVILLWGCAADRCEAMCDAAILRYEACMEERGLSWGDAYADEADYRDWCDTWSWEQRQLGTADRCEENEAVFESGNCAEYDAAW